MATRINLEKYKTLLMARRQTLLDVKTECEAATQIVELNQSRIGRLSRMDALQAQGMLEEIDSRRNQELSNIATALQRIEEGDYGFCLECGDVIPNQRLEYNPAVSYCIDCETKLESPTTWYEQILPE